MYIVGRWDFAEGGTGAIWRVRRDGSSAQEVVPAPSGGGWLSPSLSPDGSSLAYVGTDGTLFIRTLERPAAAVARDRVGPRCGLVARWRLGRLE